MQHYLGLRSQPCCRRNPVPPSLGQPCSLALVPVNPTPPATACSEHDNREMSQPVPRPGGPSPHQQTWQWLRVWGAWQAVPQAQEASCGHNSLPTTPSKVRGTGRVALPAAPSSREGTAQGHAKARREEELPDRRLPPLLQPWCEPSTCTWLVEGALPPYAMSLLGDLEEDSSLL